MSDEILGLRVRTAFRIGTALAVLLPVSATAGETVLFGAAPNWVEPAKFDLRNPGKDAPSDLLYDWQYRMEGGVVTSYDDTAIRIDDPEALADNGTVSLTWSPDKGDLTVHRVEILRGDKTIDVLAGGAKFDTIRREEGLEQRLLDGQLTATMSVPGLKVGDILRVTHTTTLADQALGKEMQVLQYLPSAPWRVGFARAIVSWPKDEAVVVRAEDRAGLAAPVLDNGYEKVAVTLPLAKPAEMPKDAPSRFSRNAVLRAGTYADWQELSREMAPHYQKAATLGETSPVRAEAAKIMKATSDPLDRAARAVRLVQDDISYLLNGLDGGNYLPQSADETWTKRFGDCKAKTVLLTALLREMGITADPVLVATQGGDALPELLPVPGNFDHVIVHATIGGTDYWLDGTSAGTRLANLGAVPAFSYALPLTNAGSTLVPMANRAQTYDDMVMDIRADYSAGVDLPGPYTLTMTFAGQPAAAMRQIAKADDPEMLRNIARSFSRRSDSGSAVSSVKVDYDDATGQALLTIKGVSGAGFEWENGHMVMSEDSPADENFNPDRARKEWREIPVRAEGPSRSRIRSELILPGSGGYTMTGPTDVDTGFGQTRITGKTGLIGNRATSDITLTQLGGEIAAADLGEAKRAARRVMSEKTKITAPADMPLRWNTDPAELRKRSKPILAALDEAVAFADRDDNSALFARALFNDRIFDRKAAIADYTALIAKAPSAGVYLQRASDYRAVGQMAAAIADVRTSYELDPDNGTAFYLATLLAYEGKSAEALDLLDELAVGEDDRTAFTDTFATVTGLGGDTETALARLEEVVAEKPQNSSALNSECWFRGLFAVSLDGALDVCTRAVERSGDDNTAAVLDSRAMVSYRLGDHDAALKDLDAALAVAPGLAASRFMRGVILLEKGDQAGRKDVEAALRIAPELADRYARHGIKPKL